MAEYDSGIPENIEREISFIQFSEAMIKLIIRYKENVVVEKNDKMVPLKLESEGQLTAVQSGVTMSKTDVPTSKVASENTVSDVKCDSGASTRASGSLLQVGFSIASRLSAPLIGQELTWAWKPFWDNIEFEW